jgi:hypothetical protein
MTSAFHIQTEAIGKEIEFTIDDDTFHCVASIGGGLIDDLLSLDEFGDLLSIEPENATKEDLQALAVAKRKYDLKLANFLDMVMREDSRQLFADRYRASGQRGGLRPIGRSHAQAVIKHLVECYSKPHPTEPPLPSTNGHGGTNVTSMGGVQPAE